MSKSSFTDKASLRFILSILEESEENLHAQGIEAQELVAIYNDYTSRLDELEDVALLVANALKRQKDVHAVRYRVKEPLHLLKKIIRKKQEYPNRHVTTGNYLEFINDLVGVRILHLYKQACHDIGKYIQQVWELKREPYAYVKSQMTSYAQQFASDKYRIFVNERGYQAQHYIIKVSPNRRLYFVEVQVKTLFEEGWSEIDHCIRYPDHNPNELLNRLLWLLNQFTSRADEIAIQIQALAEELQKYKLSPKSKPEVTVAQLHGHIDRLPVEEQEKQYLYACLARLTGR
ncbi:RelA/SpoT domain-containing protein [Pontibacter ruber]|uniref:RelA/SpoT domain-containing protein n=1 Tax=Pontibacter ruber TaxID=1343895 RepID=A0ABW5CX10_9BACT|nr:RelA/SpoT domain-containing protein [Pontibacter ruber]